MTLLRKLKHFDEKYAMDFRWAFAQATFGGVLLFWITLAILNLADPV